MKKLFVYLIIIIGLFGAVYFFNQHSTQAKYAKYANNVYGIAPEKLNPETLKILDDPNYQNIILPDELNRKLTNKESFIVYYFGSTCPHCKVTSPVLMPLAKEMNVSIKQFNLDEFKSGWDQYGIKGTPTLIYYKEGKEAKRLEGEQTSDTFKNFMESIKKEI
ncbi:thioredoxin family protein [Paenibacillus hamazuiensis]|uniref:thioredoxin family protein n=1 Tax=Paenibacillus hamazuiensis TaxID=2936508 RepID=UPI00200C1757|nr:thioredoxin family protein [Paenibacillus hamazuiensis]